MNTVQIERHLSKLPVSNVGVYAADRIPQHISPSTAMIVNTDPHNEEGTHWVSFYLNRNGIIEYFDSYGQPPYLPTYQGFLKRNAKCRYIYNDHRLQSDDSSVCAHYCLVYLYLRTTHHNMKMMDFVHLFDNTSTAQNDAIIKKVFTQLYLNKKNDLQK